GPAVHAVPDLVVPVVPAAEDLAAAPAPAVRAPAAEQPVDTPFPWKAALAALWLGGALLWAAVAAGRGARLPRLRRPARSAPADLQEQTRALAARLGLARCPGIWLIPARVSPLLWALGRAPRLLLPAGLWERLSPEQRETLLAHELAHLRRRDHWV